jgi:phospholipase/carboxylesterase
MMFSGTVICASEWEPRFSMRRGLGVFQSHGREDPLLPYAAAERLRALWEQGGAQVSFVTFTGGHEIPGDVIAAAARYIGELFG